MKLGLLRNGEPVVTRRREKVCSPSRECPEVVAEALEGLCLDPGPPLLPPCCVQTLRPEFF